MRGLFTGRTLSRYTILYTCEVYRSSPPPCYQRGQFIMRQSLHDNHRYVRPLKLLFPGPSTKDNMLTINRLTVLIPNMDLNFLWLAGLFSLFGGGGPVFSTLLRSIIAESVETDQL